MPEGYTFTNPNAVALNLNDGVNFHVIGRDGFGSAPADRHYRRAPFQRGSTFIAARSRLREMTLYLLAVGTSLTTLETRERTLAETLNPELGDGTLTITRADGAVRAIRCGVASGLDFPADAVTGFARKVPLVLEAADPLFYDPTPVTVTFTGQGSGLSFAQSFPWQFTTSGPVFGTTYTLAYTGAAPTLPVIELDGPLVNPVVMNVSTGQFLRFNYTIPSGGVLKIDAGWGQKSAKATAYGSEFNVLHTLTSDSAFWSIGPGSTQLFISADAPKPGGVARITYYNRYPSL